MAIIMAKVIDAVDIAIVTIIQTNLNGMRHRQKRMFRSLPENPADRGLTNEDKLANLAT